MLVFVGIVYHIKFFKSCTQMFYLFKIIFTQFYLNRLFFYVFNNCRYGVLQNVARSLGYANANAGRFVGMDVKDPAIDFSALARSMGVAYERADERPAIQAATGRAIERSGPTLIEITIR